MVIIKILYVLLLIIAAIVGYTVLQIKLCGMKVKDFISFITESQNLETLYKFCENGREMSSQEQIIFLMEAEKLFKAFEKVPSHIWEDDYYKYSHILEVYRSIKMLRWANANS